MFDYLAGIMGFNLLNDNTNNIILDEEYVEEKFEKGDARRILYLPSAIVRVASDIIKNRDRIMGNISRRVYLSSYKRLPIKNNIDKYADIDIDLEIYRDSGIDNVDGYIYLTKTGRFVAFVSVKKYNSNDIAIDSIIIEPNYLYRGLFHQLVDVAVMDLNANTVYVSATDNTCKTIYKKCGFIEKHSVDTKVSVFKLNKFKNMDKTKKYPVFLVTSYTPNNKISDIIVTLTKSYFSHASISLDYKLNTLYSFGDSGARKETLSYYKKVDGTIRVNCILVSKNDFENIKEEIDKILNKDTSYDYRDLLDIYTDYEKSTSTDKMICSQFVYYILNNVGIELFDKSINKVTPDDISRLCDTKNNIYKIYEGEASTYDYKIVKGRIDNIIYKI